MEGKNVQKSQKSNITFNFGSICSFNNASCALAASYTKIDDVEGIIYNAVAYKDGKFYIDGEPKKKVKLFTIQKMISILN